VPAAYFIGKADSAANATADPPIVVGEVEGRARGKLYDRDVVILGSQQGAMRATVLRVPSE
jgi:hypothetical protein